MTITTVSGTQLLIKIGNGADPEVFATKCLINTKRGIKHNSSSNKQEVPDCDLPDAPSRTDTIVTALSTSVDGAGKLHRDDVPFMDAWYLSGDPKNVQVWLGTYGYWPRSMKLTQWEASGDKGQYVEASLQLDSDGVLPAFVVA